MGLSGITTFKIESSSCSGAMAVNIANKLLNSNDIESILVIGADPLRNRIFDFAKNIHSIRPSKLHTWES